MSVRDSQDGKHHGRGDTPRRTSRRNFLRSVLTATPALGLLGCTSNDGSVQGRAPVFFTPQEAAFIDAATQRLIPADTLGGGANEAGITTFLDLQLAGAYGRAERWYMQGPWPSGSDQQGFQLKYTPAQIYRDAIKRVDAHCRQQHGKPFAQLDGARQDELLHALEQGKLDLGDIPAKTFFTMLWQNTQEGYLADPAYSGNRDFAGWKLIGFPGPRYNYVEDIEQFGKPYQAPFVSLVGRDPSAYLRGES
ncbi:gluconate 2-dehydrogenase subunit 3 family protein [Rhodanobacter caeni]|uniref:gluconate 2-dehydrogenase subunit 3 family protein n=1 Tax=Rhodanobacter caeni TaxID=657654 RepID=UPI0031D7D41C